MPASEHAAEQSAEHSAEREARSRPAPVAAPTPLPSAAVSMRDLLASCAAASAVSTPPRTSDGGTHRDAA